MGSYIPYHKPSIDKAKEITKDAKTALEKYKIITKYVNWHFVYDYIRAIKIAKNGAKPDIEHAWKWHMGICNDIAAMTTGMMRAVGIDAKMCVGPTDRTYHAWVEADIDGKHYRFDHRGKAKSYKVEKTYI